MWLRFGQFPQHDTESKYRNRELNNEWPAKSENVAFGGAGTYHLQPTLPASHPPIGPPIDLAVVAVTLTYARYFAILLSGTISSFVSRGVL